MEFNVTKKMKNKIDTILTTLSGWLTIIAGWMIGLSTEGKALLALAIFFILDFITGTWASWAEFKKTKEKPKVYFIESGKLRQSIAKAVGYFLFIAGSWVMTILYFSGQFELPLGSAKHTVMSLVIGSCIAIELWSNIENIKRLGFDIIGRIETIAKKVWSLKKILKNEKDDRGINQ